MHIKRMKALADFLDKLPKKKFNMGSYIHWKGNGRMPVNAKQALHSCGTTACVAGWVELCHATADEKGCSFDFAKNHLDLTTKEAEWLFHGHWSKDYVSCPLHSVEREYFGVGTGTPKQAAKAIRAMVECEGIPSWTV